MSTSQLIDMSKLPAPAVVEVPDFELVLASLKADLVAAWPPAGDVIQLESEPLTKWLERMAYQLVVERSARNDSCHAVMLAYATGSDLDQLGAFYDVWRLVLVKADPDATPPIEERRESDDDFRTRIQLAPRGYSVAGPTGAYIFHARSAHAQVLDASATSPTPGQVLVSVLARDGDGVPTQTLLDAVHAALNAETVRPLTDEVRVQAVGIVRYRITATVYMLPGPDTSSVMDSILVRVRQYVDAMHRIGRLPTLSGIYAALHIDGVARVDLRAPQADVAVGPTEASYCEHIQVDFGGVID